MKLSGGWYRNQNGSAVLGVIGYAILVVVIIGVIFFWRPTVGKAPKADRGLNAAETALKSKNYQVAITSLDNAIASNAKNADAYAMRARTYLALSKLDKAKADVDQSLKIKETAAALAVRGMIAKLNGSYDEAAKDFNAAIAKDKNNAWALAQRAELNYYQGKLDKALKDCNEAIILEKNSLAAKRLKAWILNRMGRCSEASKVIEDLKKTGKDDPWSMQDTAWFYLTCQDEKLRNPNEALVLVKAALEKDKKNGRVHETLAEAYFRTGDPVQAAAHQKEAIKLLQEKATAANLKELQTRLSLYEAAVNPVTRTGYEIISIDGNL
jgi:tetratricopeptide (TPR) repeat protein